MEKVVIFGINGFTGKHFQKYIAKHNLLEDYSFVGVDKDIDREIEIEHVEADLLEPGRIREIVERESPHYILNFVGLFRSPDFDSLLNVNAGVSQKILDAILRSESHVKKVLLIGSAAEYGRQDVLPVTEDSATKPVSLYGLAKVVQTEYALFYHRNYGVRVNIARPFNILGKNLSPALSIGSFMQQIKAASDGDKIFVGNLNTKRDFLHIEDVLDACWKILLHGKSGEIYNVCCGESFYVNQILTHLVEKSGKSLQIRVRNEYVRKNDIADIYGDNSKLRGDTGWAQRIGLFDSLNRMF